MKPDWKDAPEWANWLAMDRDGLWFWHESMPDRRSFEWVSNGRNQFAIVPVRDWQATLEERLERRA